jgi:hypothetical protein
MANGLHKDVGAHYIDDRVTFHNPEMNFKFVEFSDCEKNDASGKHGGDSRRESTFQTHYMRNNSHWNGVSPIRPKNRRQKNRFDRCNWSSNRVCQIKAIFGSPVAKSSRDASLTHSRTESRMAEARI